MNDEGNKKAPDKMWPHARKRWNYSPLAIRLAISGALFYKGLGFLLK
jgi:hypothetical protein